MISASQVPLPGHRWGWRRGQRNPRRTSLTSPDTLDRLTGQATGRTGMRPAARHNKESLAKLTGDRLIGWSSMVSGFYLPRSRGGAGGALFYHRGPIVWSFRGRYDPCSAMS